MIPIKVGMSSHRTRHFSEGRNLRALEENLDLLEVKRNDVETKEATNKRKTEEYFNKRVKARSFKIEDLV